MNASEVLEKMENRYALFGLFFAFHNRLQAVGDSFYEEITCKQFFLMACMNLYPDEEILNSLEKKQFIRLQADDKDRRKQRVYLTKQALLFADKYRAKEVIFMKELYDGVTEEEILHTYKTLTKIEDNLKRIKEM